MNQSMMFTQIIMLIPVVLIFGNIIPTIFIIVNSRKYVNVHAALWVILNIFLPYIGWIGYMIDRRDKKV